MRAAGILGGSFILSSLFLAIAWTVGEYHQEPGTINMTGIAKQRVTSDTANLYFDFTREAPKNQARIAYAEMAADEQQVRQFLMKNKIEETDFRISPVTSEQQYSYGDNPPPEEVTLRQTVSIHSNDVEKLTSLASQLNPLLNVGLNIVSQRIDYLYSKLDDAQAAAISDAIANAQASAEKLKLSGDKHPGRVSDISVRISQLVPLNSSATPDYTTIDTTTVEKELRVVVDITFELK